MDYVDQRWEQLRAVEADLLSPPPEDPFTSFPVGWKRAATAKFDCDLIPERSVSPPPPREPSPVRRHRVSPRANPIRVPDRRALRHINGNVQIRQRVPLIEHERHHLHHQNHHQNHHQHVPLRQQFLNNNNNNNVVVDEIGPRRRPLSPTQLPGVRAIPKDYNRYFRGLLTPGEYFAKSQTRYLGPFELMPERETLPAGDDYIILQRMGRLPDSGKSIFRQVGTLST